MVARTSLDITLCVHCSLVLASNTHSGLSLEKYQNVEFFTCLTVQAGRFWSFRAQTSVQFRVILGEVLSLHVKSPCNIYLLTPWSRALLEKLTGFHLVKKFPAFYGTRRFITVFTSARHLSLSWTCSIQSILQHYTSWRSILILSSHLRLDLPSIPL